MTTPEVIRSLIEKVEAGSGDDPELGKEVMLALGAKRTCVGHFYGPLYQWSTPWGASFREDDFRRHNPLASIDAAVALTEKLLPKEWTEVAGPYKYLNIPTPVPNHWSALVGFNENLRGWAATEPRARLSATLRALLATMEDE